MIFAAFFLGLFGLLLSASFSGSETAYYRAPRLLLKLDALDGDPIAQRLLRLIHNPSIFVATILVGNNIANYMVSVATVLAVGVLLPPSQGLSQSMAVEIGSTLLLAPLLFVYGEMFPKYLCLRAPNRMLRLLSPFILFFYYFFLPLTSLLWVLNRFLGNILGETREMVELSMGRKSLTRVLDEGQETGILFDIQRKVAANVFDVSDHRISDIAIPASHWPLVTTAMKPADALALARKHNLAEMPVYEMDHDTPRSVSQSISPGAMPIGYLRTIDLEMAIQSKPDAEALQLQRLLQTELPIRSTVEIAGRHTLLTGMILLQTIQGSFACIVGEHKECLGFVRADMLRHILCGKTE